MSVIINKLPRPCIFKHKGKSYLYACIKDNELYLIVKGIRYVVETPNDKDKITLIGGGKVIEGEYFSIVERLRVTGEIPLITIK